MFRILTTLVLVAILSSDSAFAAERELLTLDWTHFRREVENRKLLNRTARIVLTEGGEFKALVRKIEEDGIIVMANRSTRAWAAGGQNAKIPRDLVASIRFNGRTGKGGLIGGLAGLGASAAIVGGTAGTVDCEGAACGAVLLYIPICALAGYLIGRVTMKPAPAFRIER